MNPAQFDQVTVIKKANIYFDGKCISHTVQFDDGSKKTVGVILPTENPLVFETHVPERMEIISGECRVRIADQVDSELYRAGQSFYVPGSSRFYIETLEPLDYVCHLEG
ncbi:MAG: pyrimidine/purine nucleoside phosphorylase [Moraxellaceae bacterium]|nr:MAG: pyrimidine/purine nucleoside phosphorylase [Moraxellaceae bacterium]